MKLRRCATKPMGMAGISAFAGISGTIKPLTSAHFTANHIIAWSMGPLGGTTG